MKPTLDEVRQLFERHLSDDLQPAARTALVHLYWDLIALDQRIQAKQFITRHTGELRVIKGARRAA